MFGKFYEYYRSIRPTYLNEEQFIYVLGELPRGLVGLADGNFDENEKKEVARHFLQMAEQDALLACEMYAELRWLTEQADSALQKVALETLKAIIDDDPEFKAIHEARMIDMAKVDGRVTPEEVETISALRRMIGLE